MDNQDEIENSPIRFTREVLELEHNRIAGILWSHEQGSKISYELVAFYLSPQVKGIRRSQEVEIEDLLDLWKLVKDAQNWVRREAGDSASFVWTKFSVIR